MNLAGALDINARNRPDHLAVVDGPHRITHAAFATRVRQTAAHIASLVPDEGAVVGVCLKDTAAHLTVLYALARSGRVILPMDCRWTEEEKRGVAEHFGAALVIGEPGSPPVGNVPTIRVDEAWDEAVGRHSDDFPVCGDGETGLLVSLSSGTTGRPKGPLIVHRHFFRRFMTHWINLGLNGRDRFLCATPLYFGGGRTFAMSVLFSGGTVILRPPPYEADELVEAVVHADATSLFLVPTQFRRLLELSDAQLLPLRRLQLLLSSGAPLTGPEREAIRNRICPNFFEYYASTEGGGISLLSPDDQKRRGESVGRPVFGVDVEIVDTSDRPLPPGQVGILRYRGPGVATGYYKDPEASREAFRDGWFYPGDLAERDEEGFIFLRGRAKDMIIRGGINIYPAEIETTLMAHPDVAEAVVVGWPSREFGEEVAAFVRVRRPVEEEELLEWCKTRLAPYKRPKQIFQREDFSRNSAGKVVKAELVSLLPPR